MISTSPEDIIAAHASKLKKKKDRAMYIYCGERRLTTYGNYSWKIEKLSTSKSGNTKWREDSPAYPTNLGRGLQMIMDRTLIEGNDSVDITELVEALNKAYAAVLAYMVEFESIKMNKGNMEFEDE